METNLPGIGARAEGKRYCELPEGHRTTFVAGMCDMLAYTAQYVAPEHRERFSSMLRYEREFETDTLRRKFDEYMGSNPTRLQYAAASCFFSALNEWCGFKL